MRIAISFRGEPLAFELDERQTVGELRRAVADATGVAPEGQRLIGLTPRGVKATDETLLGDLRLKSRTTIKLMGTPAKELEAHLARMEQAAAGRGGAAGGTTEDGKRSAGPASSSSPSSSASAAATASSAAAAAATADKLLVVAARVDEYEARVAQLGSGDGGAQAVQECRGVIDELERVLLDLDAMDVSGNESVRMQRKDLIRRVNAVADRAEGVRARL